MRCRDVLATAVLLAGCATDTPDAAAPALPFYDSREFTPHWVTRDALPADFHRVDAFALTDHRGQTVTADHMDGKVTVVDFFFTTCSGICPALTRNMATVDAAFGPGDDVLLLSHTVTPDKDTVEVLERFAVAKGVDSARWHLLTGGRDLIYRLGRQVYFVEEDMGRDKGPDDFLHTENMVLVDQDRHLRGVYNGLSDAGVQQLIADMRVLLEDA